MKYILYYIKEYNIKTYYVIYDKVCKSEGRVYTFWLRVYVSYYQQDIAFMYSGKEICFSNDMFHGYKTACRLWLQLA